MTELSPRDASLLVLLGQVDDHEQGKELIEDLESPAAKEIGRALVAKGAQGKISDAAWKTAQSIKWWRQKSNAQRKESARQSARAAAPSSRATRGSRKPPGTRSHPGRTPR